MKYFVPVLGAAGEGLVEKLGGMPVGLPPELWPICKDCGRKQSLIGQFVHHPARLDLARDGRWLYVFQCEHDPGMCDTWAFGSGANACIVVEPEQLRETGVLDTYETVPLYPEAGIERWLEQEDAVSPEMEAAFYQDATYLELGENEWSKPVGVTRLGSVPSWIQSPDEAPSGWRFIGQLDSSYRFSGEAGSLPAWLDRPADSDGARWAEGPNFGGGLAYLFQHQKSDGSPMVGMFWQCG